MKIDPKIVCKSERKLANNKNHIQQRRRNKIKKIARKQRIRDLIAESKKKKSNG